MRKSLWIVPVLLLFAAIGALNAHADMYTPTFTCAGTCVSLPTAPGVSFPGPTFFPVTWNSIVISNVSVDPADLPGDAYTWEALSEQDPNDVIRTKVQFFITDLRTGITRVDATYFLPETATIEDTGSLTFSAVSAVPEPSTVGLMLLGIGFLLVMRKRIAQGLPQATWTH